MGKAKQVIEFIQDVEFEEIQDASGEKHTQITAIAKRANHVNKNRRYYPADKLSAAVNSVQDQIKQGSLIGLIRHPRRDKGEGPKGDAQMTAIKWTDLKMVGDDVKATGIVVKTQAGKDLQALVDAKVRVGLSTNMGGSYRYVRAKQVDSAYQPQDAFVQVFDELHFNTIDVVNGPADQFAALTAQDELEEDIKTMTLDELKKDNPDLYKQIVDEAAKKAKEEASASAKDEGAKEDKVLDEVVKLRKQLDEERALRVQAERKSIVDAELTSAKLPKLGKVGEVDLDVRLRERLDKASVDAEDEVAARTAVKSIIDETKALVGVGGDPKKEAGAQDSSKGVRTGNNSSEGEDKKKGTPILDSARSSLGL